MASEDFRALVDDQRAELLNRVKGRFAAAANGAVDVLDAGREIGSPEPPGEQLFDRAAFKAALPQVSRARLDQTLLAEYPNLREYIEQLERRKTLQSLETLVEIWQCSLEEAREPAAQLVEVGFFQRRQTQSGDGYWIPFLYRDALQLVQGREGGTGGEEEEDGGDEGSPS